VFSENYNYGSVVLVVIDVVNVMAAYQPVVRVCGTQRRKERHISLLCLRAVHSGGRSGISACCAGVQYTVEEGAAYQPVVRVCGTR
jgi:hypothetical protein